MMKSPSDQTDSSSLPDTAIQMNTERRISWQGQYQFSRPPHPSQFPGPDGQAAPRPPYFQDKPEMYSNPPSYEPSPSADPNAWQGGPPATGGIDRYSQGQPSPAHSASSHYSMDPRDVPNNVGTANGIAAAAAAAAAAMAAAAHSAKSSPGYQKPQNAPLPPPNAIPKTAMQRSIPFPKTAMQHSIPFHPNYANVQTGGPPPNVPPMPQDHVMQNHSSPYQSLPGTSMNRPMGGPQYTQWGPQQPQPNSMDYRPTYQQGYDGHMQSAERIPYPDNMPHGPMSNASSLDSEESRPKSSARSSSQKISALYEPEEPSRREFIGRVIRYWEEKELPLKHAPMMGGRTLDLYVLYQHVKKKGFMHEVTRSKEWCEISSAMGLGNTSAAGFTLKKQYCKYLYGFECHFERGEPEPQEALGRVIEANRKKKQIVEQNQAKVAENSHHDMKPGEDPHMMPQRPYPGQHYDSPYRLPLPPPGGMPYHQQMQNMHPAYGAPGHNHSVPHGPHPAQYEQQLGYPPMNVGWQQGGPHYQQHRSPPPGQPRYLYRSNGIPQNSPGHFLPQTNSLDHGQGPPPRPRFDQPPIPSRPPMQAMPAPPEVKPQPRPNHTIPPSEPVTSTSSAENQKSTPNCESVQEQKVQDSVMITAACQPTVAPETTHTQANPNLSGAPSAAATPNEKQDVPAEQSTGVPSLMTPAETPISAGSTTPQDSQVAHVTVTTPKPATSQPNAHRNTPNNAESVVQPKLDFMKSSELPKLNDCLASYKPRPELGPGPLMNSYLRAPPPRLYPPNSSTMGPDSFDPSGPYHRPQERPIGPGMYPMQHQYHQGYSSYPGVNPQPNGNAYYGQKRLHHSMEQYGPRNKIPRPDPNMYNMQYRDGYELQRRLSRAPPQRNDPAAMPHHFPPYTGGMVQQALPGMRHYPPTPHPHQNYAHTPRHMLSPMPRSSSPSVGMNMHLLSESQKPRPHLAPPIDSASKFLRGLVSAPPNRPQSGHFLASGQTCSSSPYPIGSVESVVPPVTKFKEKSAQDIGVIEAWQVILSLKSGLLAESSWALNTLSVLLHDDHTVGQIMLSHLPGLLNAVIEHYRYCLQQLFGFCDTPILKKGDTADEPLTEESNDTPAAEKITSDILLQCKTSSSNLTLGGKQLKYLPAPSRLQNPYSKLPVKIVEGENHFPLLLDTLWGKEQNFRTSEIIPITSLKGNSTTEPVVDFGISATLFDRETRTDKESLAELTFEDVLSTPSFVRCLSQNQVVSGDDDNINVNGKDFTIFPEVEKKRASQNLKVVENEGKKEQTDTKENLKDRDITLPELSAESKPVMLQHKNSESEESTQDSNASHIQSCLGRFIWSCDVALLEEEAAGFPGNSGFKAPSGINSWRRLSTRGLESFFPKKIQSNEPEMVLRILCLSNLIRSLSCATANHNELIMHPDFFKTISGTLLLGHKHRVRHIKSRRDLPKTDMNAEGCKMTEKTEHLSQKDRLNDSTSSFQNFNEANEIDENRPLKEAINHQLVKNAVVCREYDTDTKHSNNSLPSSSLKSKETSENICKESIKCQENGTSYVTKNHRAIFAPKPNNIAFSSTVLNENLITQDDDSIYRDPWWWECVKQIREDSLVILANLSTSLNISLLPNGDTTLTIMDACLHWAVCSSPDAQDPFPSTSPRTTISAQSLAIEILTKLSMKEGNIDLILATRPYARLEKLFTKLTTMIGNRKDQTLREFSIVLLSNLCNEEIAARATALQTGAISNLLSFLEECEETGLNNQRMFPAGQESVNCGTVSYMMRRCAVTLLKLAKHEENRPLFLKHHLRLLSLSMSSLLGRTVLPLISEVLFELSRESPNR